MRKTKYEFNEIFKLKDMLDKENIEYNFEDTSFKDGNIEFTSYHLTCYDEEMEKENIPYISVIQSFGSYGREQDLLEIMGLLTDKELKEDTVKGFLTSEEVFKRIKKHLNKK